MDDLTPQARAQAASIALSEAQPGTDQYLLALEEMNAALVDIKRARALEKGITLE